MAANFLEFLAVVTSRVLTDEETEAVVSSFRNFKDLVRKYSDRNLLALSVSAERRQFCKHKGSCSKNCVRGFLKTFAAAYGVQACATLLPIVLRGNLFRRPSSVLKAFGYDSVRFALFLASFVGGSKGLLCLFRRCFQSDHPALSFFAGAIAGLALLFDHAERRTAMALYMSTRSLQLGYEYLAKNRMAPSFGNYGDIILMALASSQILYAYVAQPESLPKSYYSFLLYHGGVQDRYGKDTAAFMNALRSSVNSNGMNVLPSPRPASKHIGHLYPMCALEHPSTRSCEHGALQFFLESIPRSLKLYIPINLGMSLLFRWKQALQRPGVFAQKSVISILRSSAFLSTYCTTAWLVPCLLRRLLNSDPVWIYYVNGIASGSTVLLEEKGRRLELAMYCLPRAIESFWTQAVKNKWIRNVPHGEVIYFSLCMGILICIYQKDPESISDRYRSVLTRILGVN